MADSSLTELYRKWDTILRNVDDEGNAREDGESVHPPPPRSSAPSSGRIKPSDLTCEVGSPLTEEQFKARNDRGDVRVARV